MDITRYAVGIGAINTVAEFQAMKRSIGVPSVPCKKQLLPHKMFALYLNPTPN